MILRILLFINFFIITLFLHAQPAKTSDELFKDARTAAFDEKNKTKAKKLAEEALVLTPGYAEVQIFLGKLYSWDKQFDSAAYHFKQVLNYEEANEDASIAYTDLEYWKANYYEALFICKLD